MSGKFWKFRNQAAGSAELLLYEDIASEQSWWGDEVTPKEFAGELAALGDDVEITVRINSGGGDVFAAQAIGNLLEARGKATARIDGLCASAATIVACHCEKTIAANDSTYMVHPVEMYCGYANEADLQKYLEALATVKENIVGLYARKTGRTKEEVTGWMDGESWWTGPQAKENGFVDELTDNGEDAVVEDRNGVLFVNSVSMGVRFDKAPEFVRNRAKRSANTAPAGGPDKTNKEDEDMEIGTVDDLRKTYPALVGQIEQTAEAAAREAATNAERQRIRDLEDMALTGSEELLNEAKYEKPMSAEDFAKAMVKNAKTQGAAYLAQAREDAEKSGANGVKNDSTKDKHGEEGGRSAEEEEFVNALKSAGADKNRR